jgi:uncharacterized repeat protein (TIGR03803 family)
MIPTEKIALDIDSAAKAISVSPWTIRKWISTGKLAATRLGCKGIRIATEVEMNGVAVPPVAYPIPSEYDCIGTVWLFRTVQCQIAYLALCPKTAHTRRTVHFEEVLMKIKQASVGWAIRAPHTLTRLMGAARFALAFGIAVLPLMMTPAAQAPAFSVVYTFTGGTDGGYPAAPLIADSAGNLYGTSTAGGIDGFGVVFKIDPQGAETVLYSFTGGTDGSTPYAPLVSDSAGNFYGTTFGGGLYGAGTVFKLDPGGSETVLYSFMDQSDGAFPQGGLQLDKVGNLYGTTQEGGNFTESCPGLGCGVVFKIDPQGTETVLHAFDGTDGIGPTGSLVGTAAGVLYGTTYGGGAQRGGTVFEVDLAGNETVLYNFTGAADGGVPDAGVTRDAAGNLYGTTQQGGTSGGACGSFGCGVVFKVDSAGRETVLDSFNWTDGGVPTGGLIHDLAAGNFWGTASGGGTSGSGVIFRLTATGKEKVLYNFTGQSDGSSPGTGLFRYGGYLYGTTSHGGSHGAGVVFKVKVG